MLPDGTPLRTLTSLVSGEGAKCGLVTTTTITHATPAGFAVACKSRGSEEKIAELYLDAGVDVLMGGGDKFFSASDRDDKKDMYQVFRDQGFPVVKTRAEMLRSRDEKILGVFSHSHTPYTIDRNNDSGLAHVPSLAETARLALDKLKGNPNGFLLQIEGGKVDHAAHGNDAGTMLYEQIAFEEAVKEAVEFALEDGETLVIITADHATGGASLNGAGSGYFDSTAGLESFAKMKGSFGRVIDSWGKKPTIKSIQDGTEHLLSIQLSKEEADVILSAIDEKYRFGDSIFYRNLNGTMGMVFANHTKVGFTSGNHTSDHVMLTAIGPGSEALHGVIENISLFDTICSVWGIKYKNPTMSREDAIKIERDEKRQAERELIALNADDPFHM